MIIKLNIKPLSVNAAYRGRRFDTHEKKQFDFKCRMLLPNKKVEGPYYKIRYRFFLIHFSRTDQQNLLKVLTDAIVKRGIIKDDCYIVHETIEKFPSEVDRIEVEIEGAELPVAP